MFGKDGWEFFYGIVTIFLFVTIFILGNGNSALQFLFCLNILSVNQQKIHHMKIY